MKTVSIKKTEIGSGLPKIAVPVMGRRMEDMLLSARMAAKHADLLELRLDSFEQYGDKNALRDLTEAIREYTSLPIIFTLRTAAEGGGAKVTEEMYAELLFFMLQNLSPDILDVEFRRKEALRILAAAERLGAATIASYHDFQATPEPAFIRSLFHQMADAGAQIAKAAVMPACREDVEKVLEAGLDLQGDLNIPMVLISMGEKGKFTRFAAEQLGSALTFASSGGVGSAPGQIDAGKLRQIISERHEGSFRKGDIFLVGFMGTGKSSVGKELGLRTGLPVFEMDERIERMEGRSIPRIFEESGEEYFRALEAKVLEGLFREGRQIVSCGGGTILRASNVLQMRSLGHVVLLTAGPETIYKRVRRAAFRRPLLAGRLSPEGIAELMEERRPYYERAADITVDTEGRKFRDIAFEITTRTGCTDDWRDRR